MRALNGHYASVSYNSKQIITTQLVDVLRAGAATGADAVEEERVFITSNFVRVAELASSRALSGGNEEAVTQRAPQQRCMGSTPFNLIARPKRLLLL